MKKSELREIIKEVLLEQQIKLSSKIQKKYDIPDFALNYDGRNAPEAGVYVDSGRVGDVVDFNGEKVVVIHIDKNGDVIATRANNLNRRR